MERRERAARPDEGPVLLCHDGSEDADRAVRGAAALLQGRRALVVDLGRGPLENAAGASGGDVARREGFDAFETLRAGHGPVASAVLEQARGHGASVIVAPARRAPRPPAPPGGLAAALVAHSDIPVLVMGGAVRAAEPILVCYDGSRVARLAVGTAARLLAGRAATVAAFLPAVDDGAVLSTSLPWPATGDTQDRLARMALAEAAAPAERAAQGAAFAAVAGFVARPLGIPGADASADEEEEPWRRLLRAAVHEDAACIVVGHRRADTGPASTAQAVVRHADRAVLVAPR
jgi:nucleotide-binding universal stress UspA family protein